MKYLLVPVMALVLATPVNAQDPGRDNDTPGIHEGTTLGEVTKGSIQSSGGRAHGQHAANPPGSKGDEPGREGLANIGDDLSDTIDAIDGD